MSNSHVVLYFSHANDNFKREYDLKYIGWTFQLVIFLIKSFYSHCKLILWCSLVMLHVAVDGYNIQGNYFVAEACISCRKKNGKHGFWCNIFNSSLTNCSINFQDFQMFSVWRPFHLYAKRCRSSRHFTSYSSGWKQNCNRYFSKR